MAITFRNSQKLWLLACDLYKIIKAQIYPNIDGVDDLQVSPLTKKPLAVDMNSCWEKENHFVRMYPLVDFSHTPGDGPTPYTHMGNTKC